MNQRFFTRERSQFAPDVADSFAVHSNAALCNEPLCLCYGRREAFGRQQLDQLDRSRGLLDGRDVGRRLALAKQSIELAARFLCLAL